MALNETDRLKLAEIERQLERDPTIADVFRRRPRMPGKLPQAAVCAALAYLASLVVVALVTGRTIPVLLALPPIALALALLRWPGLLRLPALRRRPR